ncbi:MAG: hypothetical protein ACYCUX_05885 [Metallibacterium sp.]
MERLIVDDRTPERIESLKNVIFRDCHVSCLYSRNDSMNAPNVQGQGRCAALSRSVPCTAGLALSLLDLDGLTLVFDDRSKLNPGKAFLVHRVSLGKPLNIAFADKQRSEFGGFAAIDGFYFNLQVLVSDNLRMQLRAYLMGHVFPLFLMMFGWTIRTTGTN